MSNPTLTPEQIMALSPQEVFAELGRMLLLQKHTGAVVAVKQPLPVRTVAPNTHLECPHCSHVGPAERDFGYRLAKLKKGYVLKPQSWCRTCRASPDSHPTRAGRS